MTKALHEAIMRRSELAPKYFKLKTNRKITAPDYTKKKGNISLKI